MMPPTATTTRTTLGLPVERFAQLRSLAEARNIAPAALVEEWITKAVAEGTPGAIELPGYSAWRDDDIIIVEIAGRALPMLPLRDALKLSILLDAAAPTGGNVNMKGEFTLSLGATVPMDLGAARIIVRRQGRGVMFCLHTKATEQTDVFSAPPSFVADLAGMIRHAIDNE